MLRIITKQLFSIIAGSRKGIRDTGISLIPQVVLAVTGLVTAVAVARSLGPAGMGRYALIISLAQLLQGLADLGIGQTAVHYASQAYSSGRMAHRNAIIAWALSTRLLITLFAYMVLFLIMPWITTALWHDKALLPLVRLFLVTTIFYAFPFTLSFLYQSERAFFKSAVVTSWVTVTPLLAVIIVALYGNWNLYALVATTVVLSSLYAFFPALILYKGLAGNNANIRIFSARSPFQPDNGSQNEGSGSILPLGQFAFLLGLSTLAGVIFLKMDLWMLGIYWSKAVVGYYAVALRFAMPLVMLSGAVSTAFLPRISCDIAKLPELARNALRLSTVMLIPVAIYVYFAPMLSPLLFGPLYGGTVVAVARIICVGYAVSFFFAPYVIIGYALGFVRWYLPLNLCALAAQVILSVLLVPHYGAMAMAAIFTSLLSFNNLFIGIRVFLCIKRIGRHGYLFRSSDEQLAV